jgi:hypothetical protein
MRPADNDVHANINLVLPRKRGRVDDNDPKTSSPSYLPFQQPLHSPIFSVGNIACDITPKHANYSTATDTQGASSFPHLLGARVDEAGRDEGLAALEGGALLNCCYGMVLQAQIYIWLSAAEADCVLAVPHPN